MAKHSKPQLITNTIAIKRNRVGKREANTKITPREEETEELSKNPLRRPPNSKFEDKGQLLSQAKS